jgi:general stress protein CsbA
MENKDYLQDLSLIKNMMNRSSRFISLSGFSGVLAGSYALIGAWFSNQYITEFVKNGSYAAIHRTMNILWFIAIAVAFSSILTAYILTSRRARKNGEKIWDVSTKNLLLAFLTPLVSGGIFGLLVLNHGYYGLIAPITLIFYGLALINASKYTLGTVKYLGISEVVVGLFASYYLGYGLQFWALGFGVLHIIYGAIMYFQYERK